MEKIVTPALLVALFFSACSQNTLPIKPTVTEITKSVTEITKSEATTKFNELSQGLYTYYDDMQDLTFCRVNVNTDDLLFFVPYIAINSNFEVVLMLQIFGVARTPLYFDKLYIKSADKVSNFQLTKTRTQEYNAVMSAEIYENLKEAVNSKYLKIRVSGNETGEKELTAEEIAEINTVLSIYEYFSQVKVR